MNEFISFKDLPAVLQTIEKLSGIKLSVYDDRGKQLLASTENDPVLSLVTATENGREEYEKYIRDTIKTAVHRKAITISKSPSGQYHFFIPCHLDRKPLILVGGAFFLSLNDFKKIISESAYRYRIPKHRIDEFSHKILIMDYEKIREISLYIQKLFYSFVRNEYDSWLYKKKHSRSKSILRIMSNIEADITRDEIYALISDILIYLFNVDSLSFMVERGRAFESVFIAGRLKEYLSALDLNKSAFVESKTIDENGHVFYDDPVHIWNLGLNEQIKSLHLFPCFSEKAQAQLLCLFNTELSKEEVDEISELCQLMNFLASIISIKNNYRNRMNEITILNKAASGLHLMFNKPEVLYTSIVNTAVKLSKAERASLLLADNGGGELSIKAVHGINKWLVKDLKINSGEGIAGKVFKEKTPIISHDIEKDFSIRKKPSYKTSSFISIPLKIGEETIGVLNVSDKITGEIFREEDLALIRYFANYASIALKGSTFYSLAQHMKELSITDPLTDLFNRRYFQERMTEEVDRSERHNLKCSLCIIDIDDFKLFNDSEGHPAGDDILIRLSKLINNSLRAIDVLARIGGEEFAVIMPQTDKDEAYFVAERIRNTVKQNLEYTWNHYPKKNITISIGVSTFPVDGVEVKSLIWNADKALYRAKMRGKDKTFVWKEHTEI
jgi:diguanylate cyclase (GGDEF)-like protein